MFLTMKSTPSSVLPAVGRATKGRAVLAAGVLTAGLMLGGAPAAVAAPTASAPIDLTDPSGSNFRGTVTFSNRSINVSGTFHSVGCRRVYATPYAGSIKFSTHSTSLQCNSTSSPSIPGGADVRGGADRVFVALTDANQDGIGKFVHRP